MPTHATIADVLMFLAGVQLALTTMLFGVEHDLFYAQGLLALAMFVVNARGAGRGRG